MTYMTHRYFALILGIAFLAIGVLGFVPPLVTHPAGHEFHDALNMQHGYLLGLFPVNLTHNAVHLLFGVWGVLAYSKWEAARMYARSVAIIYGLLVIVGLMPSPINTVWGIVPVHGHDVWLHGAIALVSAYFGWIAHHEVRDDTRDHPTGAPPVLR